MLPTEYGFGNRHGLLQRRLRFRVRALLPVRVAQSLKDPSIRRGSVPEGRLLDPKGSGQAVNGLGMLIPHGMPQSDEQEARLDIPMIRARCALR